MSLKSCIKQAGRSLKKSDRVAIYNLVDQGVSESDAVSAVLEEANKEIVEIANKAAAVGADVRRVTPFDRVLRERAEREAAQETVEPEPVEEVVAEPENKAVYSRLGLNSQLATAAAGLKQAKGQPQQMLAMLKKQPGVKAEELEWTGVEDWLNAMDGPVTKEQISEFVAANGVRVEEFQLGEIDSTPRDQRLSEQFQQQGYEIFWNQGELTFTDENGLAVNENDLPADLQSRLEGWADAESRSAGATKFGEYTLPGGTNYREVLLTLPVRMSDFEPAMVEIRRNRRSTTQGSTEIWYAGKKMAAYSDDPQLQPGGEYKQKSEEHWKEVAKRLYTEGDQINGLPSRADNFKSGHFDQPNILAHMRVNDRTGPDGEKVLFIEEVQSDWHQKGRRDGYRKAGDKLSRDQAIQARDDAWQPALDALEEWDWFGFDAAGDALESFRTHDDWRDRWDVPPAAAEVIGNYLEAVRVVRATPDTEQGVPDAPFKGNAWAELAMKRAIRMAAEGGYEAIAWTTGEQQADRYDLSKKVDRITHSINGDGTINFSVVDINGRDVVERLDAPQSQVEAILGKEVTDKILNREGTNRDEEGREFFKKRGRGIQVFEKGEEAPPFRIEERNNQWAAVATNGMGELALVGKGVVDGKAGAKEYMDRYLGNRYAERKHWYIRWKNEEGEVTETGTYPSHESAYREMKRINQDYVDNDPINDPMVLSGIDLKIGGEGMKSFYDKTLRNVTQKVAKKLDKSARVGMLEFRGENLDSQYYGPKTPVHTLTITQGIVDKAMGGLPLFKRGATGDKLKAPDIEKQLSKSIDAVSPLLNVRVVQSVEELPGSSSPSDIEGAFFNRGGVYLVADNLSAERVEEVFRHEVFGHAAVENHPDFPKWLDQIQNARKVSGVVQDLAAEVSLRQGLLDQETEAKEIIALMAERGIKHSVIDRIITAIRQVLRKAGLIKDVSEAEIRTMLSKSARQFASDADIAANAPHLAVTAESSAQEVLAAINALQPSDAIDNQALFSRTRVIGGRAQGSEEVEEAMARVMVAPSEDLTIKDRVRQTWRKLTDIQEGRVKQGLLDAGHSIRMLEEEVFGEVLDATDSAYKAYLATKNLPSVMAATLRVGAPELVDGTFQAVDGRKGVVDFFKPVTDHKDGNLMAQWEFFAAANRASRLIGETNEDGSPREKNFTQEDIDLGMALEEQYPEFRQALDDWSEFNGQILDMAESSGVVNAEERKLWENNDYVPFYRAMSEEEDVRSPSGKGGIEGQRSGVKRLTGSDEKIGSVFENMMMNTAHLIDASFKNIAMQRTTEMALETGALEKMPPAFKPKDVDNRQLERRLQEAGIDVNLTAEERAAYSKLFVRVTPQGPDVVSAMWDGKPTYYRVNDPMLLSSISTVGQEQFSTIMSMFRGPKRWLTTGVTASPEFMLANLVRDTLSTWVISDVPHVPVVDALKGLSATFKEDKDIMAIMMAGAGGGGFYDSNPDEIRKLLAKKMPRKDVRGFLGTVLSPKNAWEFWQKVGASTENATRVAIFKRVIENGGSVAEAAHQARDVLNFTMSGDFAAMKFLAQSVPFLNARVQGLYRLSRGAKENPKAFAVKGSILFAATMALLMRNNDRDEYEELPEWEKDTYWHVFLNEKGEKVGGADHWRIPKPFEIGSIFATMPERLQRVATGRDGWDVFQKQISKMFAETLAFNPTPQLAKPIIEQYANRDIFTGSPIVGLAEKNLEPELQYNAWTSEFARLMAEAMPDAAPEWLRSPRRLEHAVRAYFGTLGTYAISAADTVTRTAGGYPSRPRQKIYDMPVVKRFLRDPEPRYTKYSDQMYNMVDEANALQSSINRYREQGLLEKARELSVENQDKLSVRRHLNKMVAAIRKLNNQQRMVMYSTSLTPDEKQSRLDELTAKKNDIIRQVKPFEEFF